MIEPRRRVNRRVHAARGWRAFALGLDRACLPLLESDMSLTTQLTPTTMADYFTRFTKRYLAREPTDVVDVEVVSPALGDQVLASGSQLRGITYEPKGNALELELEGGDVRTLAPKAVWVVEEDNGILRSVEIVREDDSREIIMVRRLGGQPRAD